MNTSYGGEADNDRPSLNQNINAEEAVRISIADPIGAINAKFDTYIKFVVGILLVAVVTMLIMVATLVIDSSHFNAAVYKEYADKTEVLKQLQNENIDLLNQIKQNQLIILDIRRNVAK